MLGTPETAQEGSTLDNRNIDLISKPQLAYQSTWSNTLLKENLFKALKNTLKPFT